MQLSLEVGDEIEIEYEADGWYYVSAFPRCGLAAALRNALAIIQFFASNKFLPVCCFGCLMYNIVLVVVMIDSR